MLLVRFVFGSWSFWFYCQNLWNGLRDPACCYTAVSNIFLPNLTHTGGHLKREPSVVKSGARTNLTSHTLLKNVAPFRRKIWPHRSFAGHQKTTTRFGMSEKKLLLLLLVFFSIFLHSMKIAILTLYNPIVKRVDVATIADATTLFFLFFFFHRNVCVSEGRDLFFPFKCFGSFFLSLFIIVFAMVFHSCRLVMMGSVCVCACPH